MTAPVVVGVFNSYPPLSLYYLAAAPRSPNARFTLPAPWLASRDYEQEAERLEPRILAREMDVRDTIILPFLRE